MHNSVEEVVFRFWRVGPGPIGFESNSGLVQPARSWEELPGAFILVYFRVRG